MKHYAACNREHSGLPTAYGTIDDLLDVTLGMVKLARA